MGNVVAPAEMTKSAMTATYVVAQSRQTVFSLKRDAQPRYSTNASATVDSAKTYAGTFSRPLAEDCPATPAMSSTVAK